MSLLKPREGKARFQIIQDGGSFRWVLVSRSGHELARSRAYGTEAYLRSTVIPDLLRIYIPEASNQPLRSIGEGLS